MSCVHPVPIRSAVVCMICNLFVCGRCDRWPYGGSGVSYGLCNGFVCDNVACNVSFCVSHVVEVRALIISSDLCALVAVLTVVVCCMLT